MSAFASCFLYLKAGVPALPSCASAGGEAARTRGTVGASSVLQGQVCQAGIGGTQDDTVIFQPLWGLLCSHQSHLSAGCSSFLNFSFPPRSQLVSI